MPPAFLAREVELLLTALWSLEGTLVRTASFSPVSPVCKSCRRWVQQGPPHPDGCLPAVCSSWPRVFGQQEAEIRGCGHISVLRPFLPVRGLASWCDWWALLVFPWAPVVLLRSRHLGDRVLRNVPSPFLVGLGEELAAPSPARGPHLAVRRGLQLIPHKLEFPSPPRKP